MYIRATASISPQSSFERLLTQPVVCNGSRLHCIEPDYTQVIDPRMIRRMSRIIRMGVAAAMDCIRESGIEVPGAVITGTAYGCLADTEIFLSKMIENREELLTPTAFIQSTHNTVAAQIALLLKCHSYNNTFVHRGFSFENALLDAITLVKEEDAGTVLVGAIDELTDTSYMLLSRFGLYKRNLKDNLSLFEDAHRGTLAGEGAAFFLLSPEASGNDYAKLNGVHTVYKPAGSKEMEQQIHYFLSGHQLSVNDIDLVITGRNGNARDEVIYQQLNELLFNGKPEGRFKHLCGEYPTAAAFAVWLAACSIKAGRVPPSMLSTHAPRRLKHVLICNHYQNKHHALYLISAC